MGKFLCADCGATSELEPNLDGNSPCPRCGGDVQEDLTQEPNQDGDIIAQSESSFCEKKETAEPQDKAGTTTGGNYFIRHWRGELSLAKSFWLNYLLINFVLSLGVEAQLGFKSYKTFLAFLLTMTIVGLLITPWQIAGLWRSATNHIKRTGRAFWARAAQFCVVVAIVLLIFAIPVSFPFFMAVIETMTGNSPNYSDYTVKVLTTKELEVSGSIGFGLTKEVRRLLNDNHGIEVIHLNSKGGLVVEGRRLRDLIAGRRLDTYTRTGCFSACALAYIAGRNRILYDEAQLGFHRSSLGGGQLTHIMAGIWDREDEEYFINTGVDKGFVATCLGTPSDDMCTPTADELLKAGVVTRVTDGSGLAFSGTDVETVARLWLEIPVYRALKDYYPDKWGLLLEGYKQSIAQGETLEQILARLTERLGPILIEFLPHASTEAQSEFVAYRTEQYRQLTEKAPEACYQNYILGNDNGNTPTPLSEEQELKYLEVLAYIIRSSAENPGDIPDAAEIERQAEAYFEKHFMENPVDLMIFRNLEAPDIDKQEACAAYMRLYAGMLDLPPKQKRAVLINLMEGS